MARQSYRRKGPTRCAKTKIDIMPLFPFFRPQARPDSIRPDRQAARRNRSCQGASLKGFPARSPEGITSEDSAHFAIALISPAPLGPA